MQAVFRVCFHFYTALRILQYHGPIYIDTVLSELENNLATLSSAIGIVHLFATQTMTYVASYVIGACHIKKYSVRTAHERLLAHASVCTSHKKKILGIGARTNLS